jgi:hypothetical protein
MVHEKQVRNEESAALYDTARVSKWPTDETAAQQSRAVLRWCPKGQRLLKNLTHIL